jgi:hypothetical protein
VGGWWSRLFGGGGRRTVAELPQTAGPHAVAEPEAPAPAGPGPEAPAGDGEISPARLDRALQRLREEHPPAPED